MSSISCAGVKCTIVEPVTSTRVTGCCRRLPPSPAAMRFQEVSRRRLRIFSCTHVSLEKGFEEEKGLEEACRRHNSVPSLNPFENLETRFFYRLTRPCSGAPKFLGAQEPPPISFYFLVPLCLHTFRDAPTLLGTTPFGSYVGSLFQYL